MEDARFDSLARTLSGPNTRRGTLTGLLAGLAVPLLPGAATEAKKNKKKCRAGQLTCKIKKGKRKKKVCIDGQTDAANCGMCGRSCTAGQTCTAGVCGSACVTGFSDCDGNAEPVADCVAEELREARAAGQGWLLISRDDRLPEDWWDEAQTVLPAGTTPRVLALPWRHVPAGSAPEHYRFVWHPPGGKAP